MIGSFGTELIFETSDARVLTPSGFSRTVKGRWNSHAIIGGKPQSEFAGADLQGVTFDLRLWAGLGVRPRQMLAVLERLVETGSAEALIIGGIPLGEMWVITDTSEAWDMMMSGGELYSASVTLTLQEYR